MAAGTTNIGFEEKLWQAADKLRSNMDAAEYKHVVLGLIFLKYVSDSFEEKYRQLLAEGYGDEEDRDEYIAENIFYVPIDARWSEIKKYATSTDIGKVIDHAMDAIEKENNSLKGVLTKNYSRQELDKTRLGELVTLFTIIEVSSTNIKQAELMNSNINPEAVVYDFQARAKPLMVAEESVYGMNEKKYLICQIVSDKSRKEMLWTNW